MYSIGLMSGTSMDGIDAALLKTDGMVDIIELGNISLSYTTEFKILLKALELSVRLEKGNLSSAKTKFPLALDLYLKNELKVSDNNIQPTILSLTHYLYTNEYSLLTADDVISHSTHLHAKAINMLLLKVNMDASDIDVIGYHGQTLFHSPTNKISLQIGLGKQLAEQTGITVINDFRSNDINHGGQGAPFAPLYHQALAVRDKKYPVVVVNCGGIANVSEITGEDENSLCGFDTGPGNGLIDRFVKQYTQGNESMDRDGKYGLEGRIDDTLLNLLYEKSLYVNGKNFFTTPPPKSLDIGDFHLLPEFNLLSINDACATLEAFTADSIVQSITYFQQQQPRHWILAGGGWHNPVILRELINRLKIRIGADVLIETADEAGWNSAAMEAQIFAYLAVRCLKNLPISYPAITHVPYPLSGGCVYIPSSGTTPAVTECLKNARKIINFSTLR